MSYELFVSKVTRIVERVGYSVRFSTDGKCHTANVSDGTVITGEADGNMVSLSIPGGNSMKIGI